MSALPACLKAHPQGTTLSIKAQPRASRNEIAGVAGAELKIRIAAPPVDSAANEMLIRFLAETFDCPRGSVQLLRGQTSARKVVLLRGVDPVIAAAKLNLPG